jgi:hypothetical protein
LFLHLCNMNIGTGLSHNAPNLHLGGGSHKVPTILRSFCFLLSCPYLQMNASVGGIPTINTRIMRSLRQNSRCCRPLIAMAGRL